MFLRTTRVRCCISSFAATVFRVDGSGGGAVKVIKWLLPGAFHCYVSTIMLNVVISLSFFCFAVFEGPSGSICISASSFPLFHSVHVRAQSEVPVLQDVQMDSVSSRFNKTS